MSYSPLSHAPGASLSSCVFDAAIVDLDGTLVDTLGDFEQALGAMLRELGADALDRGQISTMVGKGSEHLVRSVLAHVGLDADPATALQRYLHHYALVNGQHAQVYPGAEAGLAGLRTAGLRLACLTNKPVAFARQLLCMKGLDRYFDHVFGGDSFARKKPHPLPVMQTCLALDSLPAYTLMVGDSRNDAEAARAAGCPVALVGYGYNHGEPVCAVDADFFIDSLEDLQTRLPKRSLPGR